LYAGLYLLVGGVKDYPRAYNFVGTGLIFKVLILKTEKGL